MSSWWPKLLVFSRVSSQFPLQNFVSVFSGLASYFGWVLKFDAFAQSIINEDKDTTFTFHALSSFHFHFTEYLTRITIFVHQRLIPLCCWAIGRNEVASWRYNSLLKHYNQKTWFNPSHHLNTPSFVYEQSAFFWVLENTNIFILQFSETLQGHISCHYQNAICAIRQVASFWSQVSTFSMARGKRKEGTFWVSTNFRRHFWVRKSEHSRSVGDLLGRRQKYASWNFNKVQLHRAENIHRE